MYKKLIELDRNWKIVERYNYHFFHANGVWIVSKQKFSVKIDLFYIDDDKKCRILIGNPSFEHYYWL